MNATGPARRTSPALTVTAVVPVLNEADNLRWLLPRLTGVDEIVVVDGQSSDGSAEVVAALRPDATIISQPPRGKGAALQAGFAAATGEVIVMLDADGSMDPAEIGSFVALVERGFDFVKGSRYACGGGSRDLTLVRRTGNRWLTALANALYRTHWSDLCYGYVALRRSAVPRLALRSTGFEIETEMCVNAVTTGLRIAEVASFEGDRLFGESHLNTWRDGWRVLRTMVGARVRPVRAAAEPVAAPERVAAGLAA
ncbi:glycosyltransferase family 2 protein [Actinomadura macrotermitis]|uniref:Undecaprenyl-phosphate 4-deoxy-4-formamido-L-arabinose transferase n=1 Tax=Actinomadura macrotermitis TaxID=2585200 RepID=A0A7K0C6L5_9ACTN|nr:glycosyltransferase family 2 protein [Actinomadura macrotermitis]MQY08986.1 Undecaprenyl-phosphate 4-deoxy-4-formamido-L-arabinose transferase [Actinomadura macrotermitis]